MRCCIIYTLKLSHYSRYINFYYQRAVCLFCISINFLLALARIAYLQNNVSKLFMMDRLYSQGPCKKYTFHRINCRYPYISIFLRLVLNSSDQLCHIICINGHFRACILCRSVLCRMVSKFCRQHFRR